MTKEKLSLVNEKIRLMYKQYPTFRRMKFSAILHLAGSVDAVWYYSRLLGCSTDYNKTIEVLDSLSYGKALGLTAVVLKLLAIPQEKQQ